MQHWQYKKAKELGVNEVKGADRGRGCLRIGRGSLFSGITEKKVSIGSNETKEEADRGEGSWEWPHIITLFSTQTKELSSYYMWYWFNKAELFKKAEIKGKNISGFSTLFREFSKCEGVRFLEGQDLVVRVMLFNFMVSFVVCYLTKKTSFMEQCRKKNNEAEYRWSQ